MTRDEKVAFLIYAIEEVEGALLYPDYFKSYTDERLDEEVEWLNYLLDK